MKNTKFLIVNNFLVIAALVAAAFDLPGIYIPFFAVSVAYQISEFKKIRKD